MLMLSLVSGCRFGFETRKEAYCLSGQSASAIPVALHEVKSVANWKDSAGAPYKLVMSAGMKESPIDALTKSSSVISYAAPIFEVVADPKSE
jgi:hypothetical protein